MTLLAQHFSRQQQAFHADPYPTLALRRNRLTRLLAAVKQYEADLCHAVATDFGQRSSNETRLLEIAPTIQGINYQLSHLKNWMRLQKRRVHFTFAPASNYVLPQPLGVVGIIVPWNYPIFLALSPLMTALAAGNQALVKLSEFTPATNHVLRQLCEGALADCVTIIEGDVAVAAEFAALPFDHLLFTGSTAVGRKVMQAAAANLTPVTLELGGKSPVLIAPDADLTMISERLLFGKTANAGQTCVAPDYVLVPRAKLTALCQLLQRGFQRFYPDFPAGDCHSAIINQRQFQRLQALLNEAEQAGATLVRCSNNAAETERLMPLTLVVDAPDSCRLWQEEIFGPVLPLRPYDDIDEAIDYIRAQPKPLALYLMSNDQPLISRVLQRVHAGGVAINETLLHVAQDDLPFGGIGPSGLGYYHGPEGFMRLSHLKAVHQKGRFSSSRFIYPPFNRSLFRLLLRWLLR